MLKPAEKPLDQHCKTQGTIQCCRPMGRFRENSATGKHKFELKPYLDGVPNEFEMDRKGLKAFIRRPDRFKPWLRNAVPWIGKRKIPRKIKRLIR